MVGTFPCGFSNGNNEILDLFFFLQDNNTKWFAQVVNKKTIAS